MRRDPHTPNLFEALDRPRPAEAPPPPYWEAVEPGRLSDAEVDGFMAGEGGHGPHPRGNPPPEPTETRAGLEKLLRVI